MNKKNNPIRVAVAITGFSSYEADIVRGVIRYSEQVGPWVFSRVRDRPYLPFQSIDLSKVDGVIGGFYHTEWADAITAAGIKAVNTSNSMEALNLPRVGPDDLAIGRLAAEHILDCGYPQFGFLVRDNYWYSQRRLEGFRAVIEQQAGLACHVLAAATHEPEKTSAEIADWLTALPKPIGIMAANDVLGRRAIECAVQVGLRVPDDVGVISVDNDEFVSALAPATLSSVKMNGIETGYRAAQMLNALMAGDKPDSPYWVLPLDVQARYSTDIAVVDEPIATEAMRFIREHCHEPITVKDVVGSVGVARTTLEVRMKRAIGKTPQSAIRTARIERAKKMLIGSGATIFEVAQACGFPQQERFSVVFKRQTGMTPSQFRQRLHNR